MVRLDNLLSLHWVPNPLRPKLKNKGLCFSRGVGRGWEGGSKETGNKTFDSALTESRQGKSEALVAERHRASPDSRTFSLTPDHLPVDGHPRPVAHSCSNDGKDECLDPECRTPDRVNVPLPCATTLTTSENKPPHLSTKGSPHEECHPKVLF